MWHGAGWSMSTSPLPVVLQPALVEEAVLRAIAGYREEHAFRRARNPLYLISAFDEREIRFQEFHLAWFDRLGLGQPIHRALAELPSLAQACVRCLVTPAPTRRDEGADLLVATEPGAACERTVAVRLRPTAFSDPDALLTLLRAELLHVADMVDPAFGYEPRLPLMARHPSAVACARTRRLDRPCPQRAAVRPVGASATHPGH